ncbi:MAG: ABC transporter permease subunit [Candidatus Abyssobacteria bacterium SURF_17]|uniref:ABC transporter permease subunit n=1 Tax=Candidatus Abyssobacteria bacterium SURF_17 TaxID=2093361 RepID=A0A419ES51_9BACT|nr:MAG: ABC transporter permease subunit [Candidatus Abyssubacteria bacterium SURF_17]
METEVEKETAGAYAPPVRREKRAKRSAVIADRIADRVITVGGIFVILAVLAILVFLVAETLPLFRGGTVTAHHNYVLDIAGTDILDVQMDEYKTFALLLRHDGTAALYHARTGAKLNPPAVDFQGKQITSFAQSIDRSQAAFGFADGTVRFARIFFPVTVITSGDLPQGLTRLDDRDLTDGSVVYSRVPGNQYRTISVALELEDALMVSAAAKPLVALDLQVSGEAERGTKAFVAMDSNHDLTLNIAETVVNLLTGEKSTDVITHLLPPLPADIAVHSVLLSPEGNAVIVAARTGRIYRYNSIDLEEPFLAETAQVLPSGVSLGAVGFLLGGGSLVVGGSDGSLTIFFLLGREDADTQDGQALVRAREFKSLDSPIVQFDANARGKSFAVADAAGNVKVFHGTSQKTLASLRPETTSQYRDILLAPRMDGLMAITDTGHAPFWEFSVPHPETTFRTLFRKVWYEGHPEPTYTWQSSAATDEFESKISLIPLIFGTVKAAFYSLLFAIPIAVLGAIYTSEFVHHRVRAVMKPTMEMMASLPSVVLGFVAALVLAPVVETWIAAVILAFVALPISLMLAACLWQVLPLRLAIRLQGLPKFCLIFSVVLTAMFTAYNLGPLFEALFFEGDFRAWVSGSRGGPEPFLFLLCLPITFSVIAALASRFFGRTIATLMRRLSHVQAALLDMARWLAMVAATVICSYGIARLLGALGVDARGGFVDTYVQRNTLVVGFAMGFAVIPIIYTIAEDALNAVPEHLRAASLACGATPWQTAIHVVLPTAISGVFSAVMIGMGRAVGETMIVVMSAGNTPIIDMNIFNGLRALSATIAVELPEAVKDGTLYRVLFLAGLVLFSMTFVINTVAELVRLRFRRRAMQL